MGNRPHALACPSDVGEKCNCGYQDRLDAERYRWLKERFYRGGVCTLNGIERAYVTSLWLECGIGDGPQLSFDEAVDAARNSSGDGTTSEG